MFIPLKLSLIALKFKMDLRQRLAESFETALRLADGIVKIVLMDEKDAKEIVISANFACPICGYSV